MGLGTRLEARSQTSTGLVGMKLQEAGEDLVEVLAEALVVDQEGLERRRVAGSQ